MSITFHNATCRHAHFVFASCCVRCFVVSATASLIHAVDHCHHRRLSPSAVSTPNSWKQHCSQQHLCPNQFIMSETKQYTLEEIGKHNTAEDCWLIIGNASNGEYHGERLSVCLCIWLCGLVVYGLDLIRVGWK